MPGLCDLQVLSMLEARYAADLCDIVPVNHPYGFAIVQLLGLIFQEHRGEILAEPREYDIL
jgi:hypothetical protein